MTELASVWQGLWPDLQRLLITYLLMVIIGWDREKEAHSAGLRTFPIVGIASCGYLLIVGSSDASAQSRVLQGLITGVGFVGGGAILKDGLNVKGMATAASIWNAGVIGAAVAMNRFGIAIGAGRLESFHAARAAANQDQAGSR